MASGTIHLQAQTPEQWFSGTPVIYGKPSLNGTQVWVKGKLTTPNGPMDCALILRGGSSSQHALGIHLYLGHTKNLNKFPDFPWDEFSGHDDGNEAQTNAKLMKISVEGRTKGVFRFEGIGRNFIGLPIADGTSLGFTTVTGYQSHTDALKLFRAIEQGVEKIHLDIHSFFKPNARISAEFSAGDPARHAVGELLKFCWAQ